MAYSLDTKTQVATMDGVTYGPKSITDAKTGTTQLIGLTEDECKALKIEEDARPAWLLERLRQKRNLLLAETDWSRGDDVPDSLRNKYTEYRQKLRDITKTYNNIEDVTWPTKPS